MNNNEKAIEDYLVLAYEQSHELHRNGSTTGMQLKAKIAKVIGIINPKLGIEYASKATTSKGLKATVVPNASVGQFGTGGFGKQDDGLTEFERAASAATQFGSTPPNNPLTVQLKKKPARPVDRVEELRAKAETQKELPLPPAPDATAEPVDLTNQFEDKPINDATTGAIELEAAKEVSKVQDVHVEPVDTNATTVVANAEASNEQKIEAAIKSKTLQQVDTGIGTKIAAMKTTEIVKFYKDSLDGIIEHEKIKLKDGANAMQKAAAIRKHFQKQ